MAGYTGPWEVVQVDDLLSIMPYPITGRPDTFLGIAFVQEHDGERATKRVAANARLIAAAPELLDVARLSLKTILDEAEARNFDPPANSFLVSELEAAILRATGEAQ